MLAERCVGGRKLTSAIAPGPLRLAACRPAQVQGVPSRRSFTAAATLSAGASALAMASAKNISSRDGLLPCTACACGVLKAVLGARGPKHAAPPIQTSRQAEPATHAQRGHGHSQSNSVLSAITIIIKRLPEPAPPPSTPSLSCFLPAVGGHVSAVPGTPSREAAGEPWDGALGRLACDHALTSKFAAPATAEEGGSAPGQAACFAAVAAGRAKGVVAVVNQ